MRPGWWTIGPHSHITVWATASATASYQQPSVIRLAEIQHTGNTTYTELTTNLRLEPSRNPFKLLFQHNVLLAT